MSPQRRWLTRAARLLVVWLAAACSPRASEVPLGLGPLAALERDAASNRAAQLDDEQPEASERSDADEPNESEESTTGDATGDDPDADQSSEETGGAGDPAASEAAARVDFSGLYAGEDVAIFRFEGLPEREQRDERAKIRIRTDSSTSITITLINSDTGKDLCALSASVSGNVAEIHSGQPCFSEEDGPISAELTTGQALLDSDTLTLEATGTLELALGDRQLDGDLSYSFEGRRQ